MKRSFVIYQKVGSYAPKMLVAVRTKERAEQLVSRFEREDRYELNVEGYDFPYGLPEYLIIEK